MKNIRFLAILFLIFTTITFSSCENEPIDPAIDLDDFNEQCDVPTSFQASNFINNNSVSLSWVAGSDETSWTIEYGVQGFVVGTGTTVISTETTYVVSGLNGSLNYSFYIKSNCNSDNSSALVGPINVTGNVNTPTCTNPTGLTAIRNTTSNTTINLAWIAGGAETSWEIQYGVQGFTPGSGSVVTSTTLTKQISNISAASAYDFYVRAKCSATENSAWVGPVSVSAVTSLPVIGYMNANVNGVQYNQMKPAYYTVTGLPIGVNEVVIDTGTIRTIKIQGNSDPFFSTTSGVEINLILSQQYWQPGTYTLKSAFDTNNTASQYPFVDLIIQESGPVVYENEIPGTITITEFSNVTKRIQGTFSFNYMTSDGNGNQSGPFNVINGEFGFTLKDEVFQ